MFKSLRTQLLIVMISLFVVTFVTVLFFSRRITERSMQASANEGSQNAMKLAMVALEDQYKNLLQFKATMFESYQRKLRDLVMIQDALVRSAYQDAQRGKLTTEAAQRDVLEKLRLLRYGENDYFWVSNYQSTLISHPDDKLNGADFSQIKDVKGNLIVPPMVEIARKQGTGYYSYWWKRLGTEEPIEKLSYAKHFQEWEWVCGTGFYIDDIEKEAQRWIDSMIDDLRKAFAQITIANTGYLFVFDKEKRVIIHPTLKSDELASLKDPVSGRLLFDELVEAAKTPNVAFEYAWDRPDHPGEYRFQKQSYVTYFEPLGWYLASSVYQDELYAPMRRLGVQISLIFAVVLLAAIIIAIMFAHMLSAPIRDMGERVKRLSNFDLNVTFNEHSSLYEISYLSTYLNEMLRSFRSVVGQVQHSGIQVTSSATELSATAKEQEATMESQIASTSHVVTAVKDISELSTHLAETMENVAVMLNNATGFANKGQSDLLHMEEAMRHMEEASRSISGRLEAISEKTDNITTVVTTINKVAEQTNLLSLNASIEAEKAGEFGRGFTVVAREIRRLADQTAVATLDIGRMVQEMQSAVSSGIMEMDKFIAEVRHSAEDVGKISMQLTLIIDQVQALAPSFDEVNAAMGRQSRNGQHINSLMANLSEEMDQTREALHETYSAIEQLNDAARGLQKEVSRFQIN
ncbi:methyl-accepting chemotaxis sensory transducer with Cache sensor [Candidatus Moduliflexus flocculans]|uniref:Methyl-accepting chemotaxis sensory transducer with Cache sensor n=1 Tax=Candidatus Moduliflexus flocculans TaxID=1499966 RepID=A0A0S6W0W3_9BACT|nr:methyl-accepting chemotaxis sensory transducer with Cache sensor [Candidatus Moduliflexus flocculans]